MKYSFCLVFKKKTQTQSSENLKWTESTQWKKSYEPLGAAHEADQS